ncbi:MAG TPA: bifunctional diaminohydroxyphosphoribosylaminopyrimidine deaminase/5-amino-6-(5-phosphoribosylamino)uracil reductase RibD [Prolixibacteraceae bacterium]|nr:bifunctional diaminohydroxyphosphoribosylaminopyrimidine deaminase/5-amino-6-(5-phosphoribosylamino)uracil reductase RibD [Prolixibacteraceae bacterium]
MSTPEIFMQRCLDLALLGMGNVAPNPMVGCVIVHEGIIIGEGYHEKYGEAHAEVNAIRSVKNPELLPKSTLYVSLEPCAHFGKTPPCSDLIIENQIPHVIIGTIDPFAEVAGKGIEKMRKAGIEVEMGLLEKKCRTLNRRFFIFHEKKRPYIILKWAQTLDGFIDTDRSETVHPTWITNALAKRLVHKQRSEESAILIGTNTAQYDNPALTVREWSGTQPIRMVIDRVGRLDPGLQIFDRKSSTWVFTSAEMTGSENLKYIRLDFNQNILPQLMDELYRRNILSVIVEGGSKLLNSFIDINLWDEAFVYTGNQFFGKGVAAPHISGKTLAYRKLDDCKLHVLKRKI